MNLSIHLNQIHVEGILNAIKRMPFIQEVIIRLPLAQFGEWRHAVGLKRMDDLQHFQEKLFSRSAHLQLLVFQSFMWIRQGGLVKFISEPQNHPGMHAIWPKLAGFYKEWNEDA